MDMEITVTELDVIDQFLPADMAARDDTAAKLVSSFLEIICEAAQPVAILTWGPTTTTRPEHESPYLEERETAVGKA
jgi:endo-1,4-beta-xylanase